ncbi:MAG: decarboxylating NADP(+)-dependent phosphogluconate dehydrogenase [Clostridiaceae bacterium]|jgi:6-phosphogluconate dehydrogenase|nr:decarboxylating NADP(+)-dependent phosphogluconate dehydrogenase [Clostridiaceae bacterium]
MQKSDIGLIGLAVMGENLVMNMESKGFSVSVYNRSADKVKRFTEGRGKGKNILGTYSVQEFIGSLTPPRIIMMMVRAGSPVDDLIEQLIPHLSKGDILIDGGNSHYLDTIRRTKHLEQMGFYFIGAGVSGGEEGALKGPSIMPGGSPEAWPLVRSIFQAIAAKVEDGTPCCDWVGEDGAGHFVKMVHNGIEYGDMQLICEAYHLMKDLLGYDADTISEVFDKWNQGELNSYLIEITRDIMKVKDDDGKPLVDIILDAAGQKGTGKWTVTAALDHGVPLTLIGDAVFARSLSAMKEQRVKASKVFTGPPINAPGDRKAFCEAIRKALYASKIVSYAQGFALMRAAAENYGWRLNYGGIALMWRGGCIIRSVFLGEIKEAFDNNPDLENLMLESFFMEALEKAQVSWREVVAQAVSNGIPVPAMSSALAYYDGYRTARLPANLLQAQRDYFGAHTFERVDRPRGEFFHHNWTGSGGTTPSSSYNA